VRGMLQKRSRIKGHLGLLDRHLVTDSSRTPRAHPEVLEVRGLAISSVMVTDHACVLPLFKRHTPHPAPSPDREKG